MNKECACLYAASGEPVPLVGVDLRGEVFGAHARFVLRQRYKNEEAKPIEAVYVFPVPSDATLVGFAMECRDRRVEAEVKEREEAFRIYDDAIASGHGAALLDQERRNVFTASVGNLLPAEETVVEIVYVEAVRADEGALRVTVPTLVAPRYIPGATKGDRTAHGAADPTDRVPDADRISPKIGAVKYGLAIDVLFDVGRDVTVESPSHAIVVAEEGSQRRRVRFAAQTAKLDRDLVLVASGAEGALAGVVADKRDGAEGTFALTIVPDLFDAKRSRAPREIVFAIDVSGSMQGASIEQARTALKLCLRHLSEGDRFDIIAFQSTMTRFKPDLVPFTQKTLAEADAFADALFANGGTEMLEPLLAAVAGKRAEATRVVVLLTDGQVGNEQEIVARVLDAAGDARFTTFGIGTNVSDLLIRDLARRTRGACDFIYPGERIDEKVTAQFARAIAPRVEGVTVSFSSVDAGEIAPSEIPDLVDGEPWVLYGRYAEPGMGRVEVRGRLRGERFFLEIPIDLPRAASREGLAALWASARILDLEAAESSLAGRRAASTKERIVELSTRHHVASKYASFVVVEKRTGDRRAHGQPETRAVPVSAPFGWATHEIDVQATLAAAPAGGAQTLGAPMKLCKRTVPASAARPPAPAYARASAPPTTSSASAAPPPASPAQPSFAARVAGAVGSMFRPSPPAKAPAPRDFEPQTRARGVDDVSRLFEQQLANGLFPGDEDTDEKRVAATGALLRTMKRDWSYDASHAVFGGQIAKAVDALLELAAEDRPELSSALAIALAAAFDVAGRRQRARVLEALQRLDPALASSIEARA